MSVIQKFIDDKVEVKIADITLEDVDAVVNAANSTLLGGGGVDGAIHRAGGPEILAECKAIRKDQYPNGLPVGQAVLTAAGNMQARYVIHTVGPRYDRIGERLLLGYCYRNCLTLAAEHELSSVAFPAISTGAFGYPRSKAAEISSHAIAAFLHRNDVVNLVRLVFFDETDAMRFLQFQAFDG